MGKTEKDLKKSREIRKEVIKKYGEVPTSIWNVSYKGNDFVWETRKKQDETSQIEQDKEKYSYLTPSQREAFEISGKSVRGKRGGQSELPYSIIEKCLRFYTEPYDIFLNPVTGVSTSMTCAFRNNRHFIGYNVSKEHINLNLECKDRLLGIKNQRLLFDKKVNIDFYGHTSENMYELADNSIDFIFFSPPYWCLTGDSLIITKQGIKEIKEVNINDEVYTHKAKFMKVNQVFERDIKEKIYEISLFNNNQKLKITTNHKIFAEKSDNCIYYKKNKLICFPDCSYKKLAKKGNWAVLKCKNFYKRYKPKFIEAKKLNERDFLVYPIDRKIKEIKEIKISDYIKGLKIKNNKILQNHNQYGDNTFENKIKLDKDFLRLCGYFLAEGYTDKCEINFSFNIKEKEYIKDVIKIIEKKFKGKAKKSIVKNVYHIIFYSFPLCQLFKKLFGDKTTNKKIPEIFMNLPLYLQKELIKGYYRGDGCSFSDGYNFTTTSYQLAEQIKQILFRFDILVSYKILERERYAYFELNRKKVHFHNIISLNIINTDAIKKFDKVVNEFHKKSNSNRNDKSYSFIYKDFVFYRIRKIKEKIYSGKVYNLEVEKDNSYCLNNICVHNCLEYYGNEPEQLGYNKTYKEFLFSLLKVIKECYRVLKKDKFCVINVNDFRKENHFYTFHADVIKLMKIAEFKMHDVVIMKYPNCIGQAFASQVEGRKTCAKMHEYLLVGRKINKDESINKKEGKELSDFSQSDSSPISSSEMANKNE